MILKEINNTLILVWSHTLARASLFLIIFVSLLISIFFSIFSSVVIITSYFCGSIISFLLIKYKFEVGFCLHRLTTFYHGHVTPKKKHKTCNICDNKNCNRHQSFSAKEPWKDLLINRDLNFAIENFYDKILENFVSSWYVNFSEDKSFVNELRSSVRFATSTILLRYLEIDLGNLVTNKLIPCALKHVHQCLEIHEKAKKENVPLEKAAVEFLSGRLHAAVTNRDNELEYLRQLTKILLPNILSKSHLRCKNFNLLIREIICGWVFLSLMDVVADPNIINLLINLIMSQKKKTYYRKVHKNSAQVELLYNFSNYGDMKKAALGYDLAKIFKDPEILYSFMQFLKDERPVNILQFCLDVEEFNRKLLTPELSRSALENLHFEATQLYDLYLKDTSPDFIGCPAEISTNIEHLLQSGAHNIPKLRTSTPLYKAYDYAFNILETQWLPVFYHSDEFYKLACGSKVCSGYQRSAGPRSKKVSEPTSQGTVSKISSGLYRIKGALRNQPIEGAVYPTEPQTYESDPSMFIEQNIHRDLSAWRVSIGHAEHAIGTKPISVFHINIKRIDSCTESERYWTVQRHDQDFYTLKIKLVEFHGENEICDSPLPSRRSTTPLETRRQKYEEFLQKLLQKPSLRGSDLLYTFLTTKQNFTLVADTSGPFMSDLENIYQSVAHKLRKERGQHLDSFMSTFLASTETGKSKINKFENPDVGEEADSGIIMESPQVRPRNIKNSVFGNNFNIPLPENTMYNPLSFNPRDIIQCSSFLLQNIFRAPNGVLKLFNAVCSVAYQAVELITRSLIEREIKSTLSEQTLAHLITQLQDVLFSHKIIPPTKEELEERKLTAFKNIAKMHRGFFTYWLGLEINEGLRTLLNILQHPQLNKQLAYSLLDIIVLELYPESFTENTGVF